MGIEEILYLEIEGLTNTIRDYTRDNFILSYSNKLNSLSYPDDKLKINMISKKLLSWYEENIEEIKGNHYIQNLNTHLKSMNILKELYQLSI